MKKSLALLAVPLLALGACGSTEEPSPPETETVTNGETVLPEDPEGGGGESTPPEGDRETASEPGIAEPSVPAEPPTEPVTPPTDSEEPSTGQGEQSSQPEEPAPPVDEELSANPPHTEAGAILFARYVTDMVGKSVATNDTEWLTDISTPDCRFCRELREHAAAAKENGAHIEGFTPVLVNPTVTFNQETGIYRIDAQITGPPSTIFFSDGAKHERPEFPPTDIYYDFKHDGTRWLIVESE